MLAGWGERWGSTECDLPVYFGIDHRAGTELVEGILIKHAADKGENVADKVLAWIPCCFEACAEGQTARHWLNQRM